MCSAHFWIGTVRVCVCGCARIFVFQLSIITPWAVSLFFCAITLLIFVSISQIICGRTKYSQQFRKCLVVWLHANAKCVDRLQSARQNWRHRLDCVWNFKSKSPSKALPLPCASVVSHCPTVKCYRKNLGTIGDGGRRFRAVVITDEKRNTKSLLTECVYSSNATCTTHRKHPAQWTFTQIYLCSMGRLVSGWRPVQK